MLTDQTRWSLGHGKPLVPSRWQATECGPGLEVGAAGRRALISPLGTACDGTRARHLACSRHTQSDDPSGSVTQWLHRSISVSTVGCPREPRTCRAVDLPVPDMPVLKTIGT
jgi:hypothetical protein